MRTIKVLAVGLVLLGLSACSSPRAEAPTHKARASACLITPENAVLGTPDKQLGFDLVESKIIYGLNAKEVSVPVGSSDSQIDALLFTNLKAGCVYFLSSDAVLNQRVSSFVGSHKYVVGLVVGGEAPTNQPANVRYIADDLVSGAALAGFAAAAKSTTANVYLVVQNGYFQAQEVIQAFTSGVEAFNQSANKNVDLNVVKASTGAEAQEKLAEVDDQVVRAVFAGKAIWKVIKSGTARLILAADLQLGQSTDVDSRVFASVERNLNGVVLATAKELLDKEFNLDPMLSEKDALLGGYIQLKLKDEAAFDGATVTLITAYKEQLIAEKTN